MCAWKAFFFIFYFFINEASGYTNETSNPADFTAIIELKRPVIYIPRTVSYMIKPTNTHARAHTFLFEKKKKG